MNSAAEIQWLESEVERWQGEAAGLFEGYTKRGLEIERLRAATLHAQNHAIDMGNKALKEQAKAADLLSAAKDVLPLLAECDCIHSDRVAPLCPCRALRAAIERASPRSAGDAGG